ncbi:MAG: cobalt-precorrin 5A hydrolase [Methanosarcinaceae archaeon]|nr:cobalt-precorrin 5A hydrolase [Methanosarcinaceae archaeon]
MITFERNLPNARRLGEHLDADVIIYHKGIFREAFEKYDAIVAMFATGIVVRDIAPLLKDKWTDPAMVVVDSKLDFAIALLGGHHGANELVRKIAQLGTVPVITTATEVHDRNSVEGIAAKLGCDIVNKESTRDVNCALLEQDVEVLRIKGPKVVVVDNDVSVLTKDRRRIIIGIGARRGVTADETIEAIEAALEEIGASRSDVDMLTSAKMKENETGLIEAAKCLGLDIQFIPHEVLNRFDGPSESQARRFGLKGVAEPSALALSDNNNLIMKKKVYGRITIAIAE